MINKINIFDCGGVLLDSTHRYSTILHADGIERIDLDFWIQREHLAYDDKPLPTAFEEYKTSLEDSTAYTILATAAIMCENRLRCLKDKIGMPDYIISRNGRKDSRSGADLKIAGLNKLLSLRQFNEAKKNMTVYEDNFSYLTKICKYFHCRGVYIPSNQGH